MKDLSLVRTRPDDDSHLYKKSPSPTAEQANVIGSYKFTVTLLASMVIIGGDTKIEK